MWRPGAAIDMKWHSLPLRCRRPLLPLRPLRFRGGRTVLISSLRRQRGDVIALYVLLALLLLLPLPLGRRR